MQTVDIGVCVAGMQTCENAAWRACTGQVLPTEEACNGRDDDCDGTTDENLTRACYGGPEETAGVGECRRGRAARVLAGLGAIAPMPKGPSTRHGGRDDDCDGVTDEIFDGLGDPAVLVLALAESVVTCIAPMAKSNVMSVRVGPSRSCAMASTTTAMVKPMRPLIWSRAVSSALANVLAVRCLYVVRTGRGHAVPSRQANRSPRALWTAVSRLPVTAMTTTAIGGLMSNFWLHRRGPRQGCIARNIPGTPP